MESHYSEKMPMLKWKQADARNMKEDFEAGTFDAVIDKACFDSVVCGDYSGPNSKLFLSEVDRVLKDGGIYISITYGVPDNRIRHFVPKTSPSYNWGSSIQTMRVAKLTVKTSDLIKENIEGGKKIDKDDGKNFHYIYIMKKAASAALPVPTSP